MTWQNLAIRYDLTPEQLAQLQQYYQLLIAANEEFNITAITDQASAIAYHYADSLELGKHLDFATLQTIADVGTGGGFPGMVLKVKYPHLRVVLIEVSLKKIKFLQDVAAELGLTGIDFVTDDWRTFLRKRSYPIELFCARASLQPEELIRLFSPACPYGNAVLVYWAAADWQPSSKVAPLVRRMVPYKVGDRVRNYAFMQQQLT